MTIFEKIIKGEIPCKKVLESEKFLAIYDINPKAPVHILAITKECIKDFSKIDSKTLGEMGEFIKEVVKVAKIDESGYRVITNIGSDGGQEIPHLHFHILGGAKLKWDNLA